MDSFGAILSRSSSILSTRDSTGGLTPAMMDLVIVLMVLIFVGFVLGGTLYIVRKVRKSRAAARQQLPQYETSSTNHRGLTIATPPYGRPSSAFYDEKASMMSNSSSPPTSPVPEIRITFPDEQDEAGRRTSGRVVIVRVGETGIGLEPLSNEQLPAYEKETGDRFHSIDMERIGGLKEKSSWS